MKARFLRIFVLLCMQFVVGLFFIITDTKAGIDEYKIVHCNAGQFVLEQKTQYKFEEDCRDLSSISNAEMIKSAAKAGILDMLFQTILINYPDVTKEADKIEVIENYFERQKINLSDLIWTTEHYVQHCDATVVHCNTPGAGTSWLYLLNSNLIYDRDGYGFITAINEYTDKESGYRYSYTNNGGFIGIDFGPKAKENVDKGYPFVAWCPAGRTTTETQNHNSYEACKPDSNIVYHIQLRLDENVTTNLGLSKFIINLRQRFTPEGPIITLVDADYKEEILDINLVKEMGRENLLAGIINMHYGQEHVFEKYIANSVYNGANFADSLKIVDNLFNIINPKSLVFLHDVVYDFNESLPLGFRKYNGFGAPGIIYKNFIINYVLNGGNQAKSGVPNFYTESEGIKITGKPTKTGYTFAGWCRNSDLTSCSETQIITVTETGDITFYAKWTPNTYAVTLNNQGATSAGTTKFYYQYKTNAPCYYYTSSASFTQSTCMGTDGYTITLPTRTGYKFGGYFTGTNGSGEQYVDVNGTCINNIYSTIADDTTLYAKWEETGGGATEGEDIGDKFFTCEAGQFVLTPGAGCVNIDGIDNEEFMEALFSTGAGYELFDFILKIYPEINEITNKTEKDIAFREAVEKYLEKKNVVLKDIIWTNQHNVPIDEKDCYDPNETACNTSWWYLLHPDYLVKVDEDIEVSPLENGTYDYDGIEIRLNTEATMAIQTGEYMYPLVAFAPDGYTSPTHTYDITAPEFEQNPEYAHLFTIILDEDKLEASGIDSDNNIIQLRNYQGDWQMLSDFNDYTNWHSIDDFTRTSNPENAILSELIDSYYGTSVYDSYISGSVFGGNNITDIQELDLLDLQNGSGINQDIYIDFTETNSDGGNKDYTEITNIKNMSWWDNTLTPAVPTCFTYTITYNLDGGTNSSSNPSSYNSCSGLTLVEPTKLGYTFNGWVDGNGNTITKIPTGSTGNKTLTAVWIANEYTISYIDGESVITDSGNVTTYTYGTETVIDKPATKAGYMFVGWCIDSELTECSETQTITVTDTGNKTYYAQWTKVGCPESFISDEDIITDINTQCYQVCTTADKEHSAEVSGKKYYDDTNTCEITSCVNGYELEDGMCELSTYTITYNLDGGTNYTDAPTSYTIESETITLGEPTKDGYTFNGWVDGNGNTITEITTGSTGDVTLTAIWEQNTYNIYYETNGGSECISETYTTNTEHTLMCSSIRPGYVFDGWYRNEDLSGNNTRKIGAEEIGDKTFYAKWHYYCDSGKYLHIWNEEAEKDEKICLTPKQNSHPALAIRLNNKTYYLEMSKNEQDMPINYDSELKFHIIDNNGTIYNVHDSSVIQ